jgi:hypothetical protein
MTLNLQTIASVLAILILAGWTVWKELRERVKLKRYGLALNPERCKQHAEAINSLTEQVKDLKECAHKIADKVGIVL